MSQAQRFKVDLRGVVDLLSTAIYSSAEVYLRELIQNSVDAITMRRQREPDWRSAGIIITPAGIVGPALTITDDGVGLTADQISDVLASVGSSLKRDAVGIQRPGMLGRFGIGLLSALMISDEVVLTTRAAGGGPSLEWRGRSDGTFTLRELDETVPVGTTVAVQPRPDDAALARPTAAERIARHYARYLPEQIFIDHGSHRVLINEEPPFDLTDPLAIAEYGTELLGESPFAVLKFEQPITGSRGLIVIENRPVPPNRIGAHHVYASGMLVSQDCREIAPDWAFFARCVLTSTGLTPTASREGLVQDLNLDSTREAISGALRGWLEQLAADDQPMLNAFISIHYLGLKALTVHDDQIAPLIVRMLPMETSRGELSIAELIAGGSELRYVRTTDQFRQVCALAGHDQVIINASYTWDAAMLARLPELIDGVHSRELTLAELLETIDLVPADDRAAAQALEERASAVLAPQDAAAVVRMATGGDSPSFLLIDPAAFRRAERRRAQERSPGWSWVLDALEEHGGDEGPTVRVLLNWTNPLIKALSQSADEVAFSRAVELLHLQAVLASGRPLNAAESTRLTRTLGDLMLLGLGRDER